MCHAAAPGTASPHPEIRSEPRGTSQGQRGGGVTHTERLRRISCSVAVLRRTPGKNLISRNSSELIFAVQNKNAAPPRRGGFPGEERWGCVAA